ncbi:MAG: hypothetical protein IH604_02440 [Burkholderiales bacterium]|nr:hypothetical protein [Burkholderiales bacterium]
MAADKLSAKEAELIAQARAQFGKATAPGQVPAAARVAQAKPGPRAAPLENPARNAPASERSPAERLDALMAAARAESERERERQRRLYLWVPVAFVFVLGLWTLLWMWTRL